MLRRDNGNQASKTRRRFIGEGGEMEEGMGRRQEKIVEATGKNCRGDLSGHPYKNNHGGRDGFPLFCGVHVVEDIHYFTNCLCRGVNQTHLFLIQLEFDDLFDPFLSEFDRNAEVNIFQAILSLEP